MTFFRALAGSPGATRACRDVAGAGPSLLWSVRTNMVRSPKCLWSARTNTVQSPKCVWSSRTNMVQSPKINVCGVPARTWSGHRNVCGVRAQIWSGHRKLMFVKFPHKHGPVIEMHYRKTLWVEFESFSAVSGVMLLLGQDDLFVCHVTSHCE